MKSIAVLVCIMFFLCTFSRAQEMVKDSLSGVASMMSSTGEMSLKGPYFPPDMLGWSGASSMRSLRRLPPHQWKSAEIVMPDFKKTLRMRNNGIFDPDNRPRTINTIQRIEPLNYVERTRQSWWPFTFM